MSLSGGSGPMRLSKLESMTVLVTGGAGYLGSHTAVALFEAGHDVLLADDFSNSSRDALAKLRSLTDPGLELIEGDVADRKLLDSIFADHQIDSVIHFAAHKSVPESLREPLRYYRNNVGATLALTEAAIAHGARRLVFSSSAAVYGSAAAPPLGEAAPLAPQSPYAHSKAVCEQLLADAAAVSKLQVMTLRYFNPLGAHRSGLLGDRSADGRSSASESLMDAVTRVALRAGGSPKAEAVQVFGGDHDTRDGSGVRDFVHVMDVAQGHVAALTAEFPAELGVPPSRVFNLGTGTGTTVLELVAAAAQVTDRPIPFEMADRRPGDISASWADPTRAAAELGWRAERDLAQMLTDHWRFVTRSS